MVIQGNSDVYFNKTLPPLELKPKEPETQKPESQKAPVFEKSASLEVSFILSFLFFFFFLNLYLIVFFKHKIKIKLLFHLGFRKD